MVANSYHNLQKEFQSIAAGYVHVGASCVRLLEADAVLDSFPADAGITGPTIIAQANALNLSLHIHGISGKLWQSTADTVINLFANLLNAETGLESLTAALVESQDRLIALYELTQASRRTLEISELLDLVIGESCQLLDGIGGFIILIQPGQSAIIRQISTQPMLEAHIQVAATLYRHDTTRHTFRDSNTVPVSLRNLMMVSLPVMEHVFAALGIYNATGEFTSPDIKLAQAIADQTGAQLENAILYQQALARTRLETEMDLARQVQTALLPQSIPTCDGFDIYATSVPALQVGGDFFDIITRPEHPLTLFLGDVTGKGMPAALLMTMTRTVARSAARNMPFTEPNQLVTRLNSDLFDDFSTVGMFTTAFIGLLDSATRNFLYCNAGQSPILYFPVAQNPILLEAADIPIGIFDSYKYTTQSLSLAPDDMFVIASDGFPESRNESGEMFGYERMKQTLAESRSLSAREITENLFSAVNIFTGSHPQDDDRTIIILKVNQNMNNQNMSIQATYEAIRQPAEQLRILLAAAAVPDDLASGCELALTELLTNQIDHACLGDASQTITVSLTIANQQISIQTSDSGIPAVIDLSAVKMPDPSELAESGYGMALIEMLMDSVQYESKDGKNIWLLKKNLTAN